jgi:AraC family transcriptional regulator
VRSKRLADAITEVSRIQGAPPVIPEVLSGDTRLTGRWRNEPFETYMPAMKEHIIVATFSGRDGAEAKIDGKVLTAPGVPGAVTVAPRGHDGHWRVGGVVEVSNIYLGHERLRSCAQQLGNGREPQLIDRLNHRDPKLFAIMSLLCQEADSREPLQRLFMEQLLDLLCLQLLRSHSSLSISLSAAPRRGLAAGQLERVTAYMRERLSDDIGLQELADLVSLSRFHFCTVFRMATGQSPYRWLTAQRIARARALLANPALRITDIALAVGYQTPSAFAATFRRAVGVTPTEFRRRL